MKIGLVQYSPVWENKDASKEKIEGLLRDVDGSSILIFPELTLTGFTMNSGEFAETIPGKSTEFFSKIAVRKKSNVLAGIIEGDTGKYYNTLVHINPAGAVVSKYRKIHPFTYSTEDRHYTAGGNPVVTQVDEWNVGLTICYDLRFPELYRLYGKKRTELIVDIANWPVTRIEHWRTLLKARAIENQCYVAGVNRVGSDPKLEYNGFSSLFDPMGNELITSEGIEEVLSAEIEIDTVRSVREKFPFLQDIRLI